MHVRQRVRRCLLLPALIVLTLLHPASEARAQDACAKELTEAEEAYTRGRFDEAIGHLNQCLEKRRVSEEERERAYRLMGLSFIGKDVLGEARASVRKLLELVPNYQPDPALDPPPFVRMIEDVRGEIAASEKAPPPVTQEPAASQNTRKRGGPGTWLLVGGGALLAGAAAVLLAGSGGGGDDGPPEGPTTLNEVEPNDAPNQAQALRGRPPITLRGQADVNDVSEVGRTFNDGTFDDFEDWFTVTITATGLQLSLNGFASDLDLYLMEPGTLNFLGISENGGTLTEAINNPGLAPGTYLIGVSIFDPDPQGPASTSYTLTVNGAVTGASLNASIQQIGNFGGASHAADFRLVAHPVAKDAPLGAVLPDPAVDAWTAFDETGGALVEYDGTPALRFRPGRGFWVQHARPLMPSDAQAEPTTGDTYDIPLHPGWNIISNPFEGAVAWADVQAANGITQGLWRWEGRFLQTDAFAPAHSGEAFYFVNATRRASLTVPYPGTTRARTAAPADPAALLTLSIYREGALAASVQVGLADDAAPGLDGYDQLAPPGYFEAAGLRLVRHAAAEEPPLHLAREVRPGGQGQRFDLVLEAPEHASVTLRAEGVETLAGRQVYLVDTEQALVYDLHAHPFVTLTARRTRTPLILLVGSEAFVAAEREALRPDVASLSNYPNPFNPATTLAYTVPPSTAPSAVRLDVFDAAGRLVRVLVDAVQAPGAYQAVWDGADASGTPVASGVYVAHLRAGAHRQVRTMLLVK